MKNALYLLMIQPTAGCDNQSLKSSEIHSVFDLSSRKSLSNSDDVTNGRVYP